MHKRRLFIAINLPEELKAKIEKRIEEIRYKFINDIRFLNRDNWHITISFLGVQEDVVIGEAVESMALIAKQFKAPEIEFTDMGYGPAGKSPRMIWLNGSAQTAKELQKLKEALENDLIDRGVVFKREYRQMKAHVTLARFESAIDLPDIDGDLPFRFVAEHIDLMESRLGSSGAQYELLQRIELHKE